MARADYKEDWKKMQVRTFTNWFNSILALGGPANSQITSLQEDLQDGLKLVELLEILSMPPKRFDRINRLINHEQQKLENLSIVFKYLKTEANVKTVNIAPSDVHKGDLKLILGLIWTLIQHFQIYSTDSRRTQSALLAWVQAQIPDQSIKNFTTDWNDGVALCALIDHIEPGLCPKYSTLDRKQTLENCSLGIRLAEEELGVVKIIEPEDLCDPKGVDFQSVMTYVSSFCKPANERLLKWVKGMLPNVNNLNTDWQNGVNLVGLLDTLKPGGCFPNWRDLDPAKVSENLTLAKKLSKEQFGVEAVNINGGVNELGLATYLTHLRRSATSTPTDADIKCSGPGLSKAAVGRPATFEIDTTRAQRGMGESVPSVTITDSNNTGIEPRIKPNGKGRFRVEYTPWSTRKLKVDVKWKSSPIPGSPFSVDVINMATLSFKPKQNCIKVSDLIVFDVKGTSDFEDGELEIFVQDSNGATDLDAKVESIMTKSEGIVEVSLKNTQPGKYKIVTKLAGVDVPGSPFQIEIADPQQYNIQMPESVNNGRLTLNKPATFTITGRDASSSSLVAKLQSPGASEPKRIALSQHKGSVSGKFTPKEGGTYKVHVTCAGEDIPGSPIQLTTTDPQRCFFDGNLPRFVQVGTPCKVSLSTKGAGPGEVNVTSSQTEVLAVNGEQSEDCYTIKFVPKKVGESTLYVKFDGVSLPPSPHTVSVCDASKCSASGEALESGRAKCNEQFTIKVETKGAGKGELTAKLTHGSKTTCTRTLECDSDGTCNFPLMSYEAGRHLLNILWGGAHIPHSPFAVKVTCDATQFTAQGEGLKQATAHRAAKFELKGPQSGLLDEGMLQVKIRGARCESKMVAKDEFKPASEEALVRVTESKQGTYLVEYTVPAHGNFTIYVTIDEKPIPESPFNVKVHPDPTQCKVFGNAFEHPHSLVLGKSIEFKVDTTEAGTGELTATVTDPTSSKAIVIPKPDWKNKVYELKVDTKSIGEHKIDVHWNDEHIPGSPFSFGVYDPSKVKVLKLPAASRYSAEVGEPLTFLVDAKDAGKGELQCKVKVTSDKDDQLHETTVEPKLQDDGTYSLKFIPHKNGQMQLDILFNGVSILTKPWECEIANPLLILHSSNSHEKQNQPVKFMVSGLTKGTANKLKISINHPRHKSPKLDKEQQEDGSITYHFTPTKLGKYDISVKIDGEDIQGSPLSVKVVNPEACIVKGAIPATVFLQQRKQFMIDTSQAGPGDLSCVVENQESNDQSNMPKLGCKIISTDPDTATVEVSGLEPGKSTLFLKWGGFAVPQTPLDVTVYDPSQCSCKCKEISTGKGRTSDRVSVQIDTTYVGGCEPTVKARGPTTEYCVELKKIAEGKYRASFTPDKDGHQNVKVFVDDVMLPSCPLTFKTCTPQTSGTNNDIIVTPSGPEDPHREISPPSSETTPYENDASVTFAIGVETNDTDTSQLHLKTVNPKKRYRVRVKEDKSSGEWRTTCTTMDKGEQELQVLCSESELIGQPIKVSVSGQRKTGGLNYCKAVLIALLMLLALSVIATLSFIRFTDPEVRPH